MTRFVVLSVALISFGLNSFAATANAQGLPAVLGGGIGAIAGAAAGGKNAGAGALVGGIIGVSMGLILQQLDENEKQKRDAALKQAAKGSSANWNTSGSSGKKATYKKVGTSTNSNGQKCSKVRETITLADGKQGVSEETVCFS